MVRQKSEQMDFSRSRAFDLVDDGLIEFDERDGDTGVRLRG